MENSIDNYRKQGMGILQMWQKLKSSIFDVLFVLLDKSNQEEEESISGLIFETGLDYLQMVVFPFHWAVVSAWNGGETLQGLSSAIWALNLALNAYLPNLSFSAFIIYLYVLIFMIILVILDIVYVSYSFSKKKFRFTLPLVLLGRIVPLIVTILFLPITEQLLEIAQCLKVDGVSVMFNYNYIVCWEGWHLFHAVVTLIFTFIFVFISCVVAMAMFEPRMTSTRLTARENSKAEVLFILNKIACQFIFSFRPFNTTWVYCILLFLLSGSVWWAYNMENPIYNRTASKFFRVCSTYHFWACFMLMVSQLINFTGYQGTVVIWLCGLPFLGLTIFYQRDSDRKLVFNQTLTFRNEQDLFNHIKCILLLLHNQQTDREAYLLLLGYIEKHKQICTEEDCPLRTPPRDESADDISRFLRHIDKMYLHGLKKFPHSTKLRLSYAFFQLERVNRPELALQYFIQASDTQPSFTEQFIIYRFSKIIRDSEKKTLKEDDANLIDVIRFDNHVTLCQEAMNLSARLHRDFWTQLQEETPDMEKLNNLGASITQAINLVDQNFREILGINAEVPETILNYALYLTFVLQSPTEGNELLFQAKSMYIEQSNCKGEKNQWMPKNVEDCQKPLLVVSASPSNLGNILDMNACFTEVTNHSKNSLIDRHISKILPRAYHLHHQLAVAGWMDASSSESQYLGKIHSGFIRVKAGYVLPIDYQVIYSAETQNFFFAFTIDQIRAKNGYLITDEEGITRDISPLSALYFEFDKDKMNEGNWPATELFSNHPDEFSPSTFQTHGLGRFEQLSLKVTIMKNPFFNNPIPTTQNNSHSTLTNKTQTESNQTQHELINSNLSFIYEISLSQEFGHQDQSKIEATMFHEITMNLNPALETLYSLETVYLTSEVADKENYEIRNYAENLNIKVVRLVDGEFRKVYPEYENEGQFMKEAYEEETLSSYQQSVLKDPYYQDLIHKSINTEIQHHEISLLRVIALIFILLLAIIGLFQFFQLNQLLTNLETEEVILKTETLDQRMLILLLSFNQTHKTFLGNNSDNFQEFSFMNQSICQIGAAYTIGSDFQNVPTEVRDKIDIWSLSGKKKNMTLTSAMMLIQAQGYRGNCKNSFDGLFTENDSLCIAQSNFIVSLIPKLLEVAEERVTIRTNLMVPLLLATFLLCILMIFACLWSSMRIDQKKANILIWFLDIPIPYLKYLELSTVKFIRSFMPYTLLRQKGIKLDSHEHYYDEYQHPEQDPESNNSSSSHLQSGDELKASRKNFISRFRKYKTGFKITSASLKSLFFIPLAIFCVLAMLLLALQLATQAASIYQAETQINKFLLLGGSLSISQKVLEQYNTTNLCLKDERVKIGILDTIKKIKQTIFDISPILSSELPADLIDEYEQVYYGNLCQQLDSDNIANLNFTSCEIVQNGVLKSGYMTYRVEMLSSDLSNWAEILDTNENYVHPALINLFISLESSYQRIIANYSTYASVAFICWTICLILGYAIFTVVHLSSLNRSLNQTIKMLNMIPKFMLPQSTPQIRTFIAWIVQQASKKPIQ